MKQSLSLDALEVLDAIDSQGSFAAAAEYLHRVPSAITYAMQKLEQDLGLPVFSKQGRRSVLTPAGEVLLAQGRELLATAGRVAESTRQVHRGWESRLIIAVDSLVPFEMVTEGLRQFYQLDTGTQIRLTEEVLFGAWESILEERADLVLGAPELDSAPSGVAFAPLAAVEFVFAVAPDHPLAGHAKPLTTADIAPFRAVVVRDSSRHRAAISRRVLDSQPVLAVTNLAQKIIAQKSGLGVGYLPHSCIAQELAEGSLVAPVMAEVEPPYRRVLAWREGSDGRALNWFRDWFGKALA